jgi:isocitrate dehydrogenase
MCSHNYDGDVLTDEIAQVHRSPGFLTSVLNGVNDDGSIIKEFEASHGTVTDMWKAHLRGEDTSLNPLSMMEALIGAMKHSAELMRLHNKSTGADVVTAKELTLFANRLQSAIHAQMVTPGKGTRDLCGPEGLTTVEFVKAVRQRLDGTVHHAVVQPAAAASPVVKMTPKAQPTRQSLEPVNATTVDLAKMRALFDDIDSNKNGTITFEEFQVGLKFLGVVPKAAPKAPF